MSDDLTGEAGRAFQECASDTRMKCIPELKRNADVQRQIDVAAGILLPTGNDKIPGGCRVC
jgi:hypothetical protein